MIRRNTLVISGFVAALIASAPLALANTYQVVIKGTVSMEDGSPPPVSVNIERVCSDSPNGVPGPLVSKKGEWVWRLEVDAFDQRACTFRAFAKGYTSTEVDASHLNVTSHDSQLTVPKIVLVATLADPAAIRFTEGTIPPKAKAQIAAATKAMDAHDYQATRDALAAAVAGSPKFAPGWHALGVVSDNLEMDTEARDAFTHAIEADPKLLPSYVMLTRVCIKTKDWQCALKTSDSLIKLDVKRVYPEIYLHRAVAQFELKDLPGAQSSVEEALRMDAGHKRPRAEYVEGRILEAKGDLDGARQHMTKYLELDTKAPDADAIKAQLELLGKGGGTEPDLETF